MPRLLHHILPTSVLGEHKGDSKWWYAWVPVVAPILAGVLAYSLFKVPLPLINNKKSEVSASDFFMLKILKVTKKLRKYSQLHWISYY